MHGRGEHLRLFQTAVIGRSGHRDRRVHIDVVLPFDPADELVELDCLLGGG